MSAPAFQPVPRNPDERPGTVTAAGVLTVVLSLLAVLGLGLLVVAATAGRDALEDEIARELASDRSMREFGVTTDTVISVVVGVGAVMLALAVVSTVLGFLVLRRSKVARGFLVALSAMTAVVSLLSILSLVSAVWLIGSVAVIVLLFSGGAGDWFARRTPAPGEQGTGQSWGQPYGQAYGQQPGQQGWAPQQYGWGGEPSSYPPPAPPAPSSEQPPPPPPPPPGEQPPTQRPWG